MAKLFQPIQFGSLTLNNKIIIAPMCQYSATDQGLVTFWHQQQWANYALSGAGMCIVEATAVSPAGRISYADVGLWNDQQRDQMREVLNQIKVLSPMPMAVQLAHAGRKASNDKPWLTQPQIPLSDEHGWQTLSASALPFNPQDHVPHALNQDEIEHIIQDFAQAAQRAYAAGFDLIELHAAHGYLLHQFMSPLSNQRDDAYGGGLENRIRLTLEVFYAMRQQLPDDFPIGVRISAQDWVDGGWTVEESIQLSQQLQAAGAVYIHVSSGGLDMRQKITLGPNYQVQFAAQIKQQLEIPVIAVGLITEPEQAEQILQNEQADAIGLARAILYNPRWPWHAAAALGAQVEIAPQYLRCQPHRYKNLFQPFAATEL